MLNNKQLMLEAINKTIQRHLICIYEGTQYLSRDNNCSLCKLANTLNIHNDYKNTICSYCPWVLLLGIECTSLTYPNKDLAFIDSEKSVVRLRDWTVRIENGELDDYFNDIK